jgi:hypothetical protein
MTSIMMPNAFDQAIKEMCGDAVSQAVAILADKYGFDTEEANRFLDPEGLKLVRKRGPSPKKDIGDKKAKKANKDGSPKPKRAKTGYLLYADSVRPVVKEELMAELEEDAKLKPQATVSEIAKRWKALPEEEREWWNTQAKAAPVEAE